MEHPSFKLAHVSRDRLPLFEFEGWPVGCHFRVTIAPLGVSQMLALQVDGELRHEGQNSHFSSGSTFAAVLTSGAGDHHVNAIVERVGHLIPTPLDAECRRLLEEALHAWLAEPSNSK
jgi:hypothetical protein